MGKWAEFYFGLFYFSKEYLLKRIGWLVGNATLFLFWRLN